MCRWCRLRANRCQLAALDPASHQNKSQKSLAHTHEHVLPHILPPGCSHCWPCPHQSDLDLAILPHNFHKLRKRFVMRNEEWEWWVILIDNPRQTENEEWIHTLRRQGFTEYFVWERLQTDGIHLNTDYAAPIVRFANYCDTLCSWATIMVAGIRSLTSFCLPDLLGFYKEKAKRGRREGPGRRERDGDGTE